MRKWLLYIGGLCCLLFFYFFYEINQTNYDDMFYDNLGLYSFEEEQELKSNINKFIKLSGVDFRYDTVETIVDFNELFITTERDSDFGKGLNNNQILIVFVNEDNSIHVSADGDSFYYRNFLVPFKVKKLNKYNHVIGDKYTINYILDEMVYYYIIKNLKIGIIVLALAILVTIWVLKFEKMKYRLLNIDNAFEYYVPEEVRKAPKI